MGRDRPMVITIVCVVGFLGALASAALAFSDMAKQIGYWYPLCLALSAVAGSVCMAGLWIMKRWAVIAYATLFGINQVALLVFGLWGISSLVLPGLVVAIAISKYQSMR